MSSYPRHMLGSVEVTEPNEQDVRIGKLKSELREYMGQEAFVAFYKTTSMDGDILERQLFEKLEMLKSSMSDYGMARHYG